MDEPFATSEPTPPNRSASTRWTVGAIALLAVVVLAATAWLRTTSEPATTAAVAPTGAPTLPVATAPPSTTTTDTPLAPAAPVSPPAAPAPAATPAPAPAQTPTGDLGRLRIGTIGVDAPILPVGVQANGEMEVPPAADVGWYRFGPRPAEAGSAVLAAHVDFDGQRGAFYRLRELKPGAVVEVVGPERTHRFRVTAVESFPKDALPDRIFERTGPARMALITCGGEFDTSARSYRDNVVAFAEPIG